MIEFSMIPGVEINLYLIVFLSFAIGIVSGFVGVGGGFMMTPALIILGFPAEFAVGTSLMWVMGNSIVGTLRHRQLGNVDVKLGAMMTIFVIIGVEAGVRALNAMKEAGLADVTVLTVSIILLLIVGGYMLWESNRTRIKQYRAAMGNNIALPSYEQTQLSTIMQGIRIPPVIYFEKSDIRISLWVIAVIGLVTGILSGLIGVGGGFIMVPAMIYVIGMESFAAVGTGFFQIIFGAAFGSIRHTISGNVVIFAALIMLMGSSVGIQIGVLATKYLRGITMRYILAITIIIAAAGSILKLIATTTGSESAWLEYGTTIVTFGGLGLITCGIAGLLIMSALRRKGKKIPDWMDSLVRH